MKNLITIIIVFISTISIGQISHEDSLTIPHISLYGKFINNDTDIIVTISSSPFSEKAPNWEYLATLKNERSEQYSIGVYPGFMYQLLFETVDKKKHKVFYVMATRPAKYFLHLDFDSAAAGIVYWDKELKSYQLEIIK